MGILRHDDYWYAVSYKAPNAHRCMLFLRPWFMKWFTTEAIAVMIMKAHPHPCIKIPNTHRPEYIGVFDPWLISLICMLFLKFWFMKWTTAKTTAAESAVLHWRPVTNMGAMLFWCAITFWETNHVPVLWSNAGKAVPSTATAKAIAIVIMKAHPHLHFKTPNTHRSEYICGVRPLFDRSDLYVKRCNLLWSFQWPWSHHH